MGAINIISSLIWKFLERCGSQLIGVFVAIVLARLLPPVYHGVLALALVLTGVLQIFVDCGFSSALVQKKDADDLDFSSVFFFNFGFCLFLYLLLFVTAPWMEQFFNMADLAMVIRVLGVIVIIFGFRAVQEAYVARNLLFRLSFRATVISSLLSGVVGIYMAYAGYGIWALVGQQVANNLLSTLILWIIVPWLPNWQFSFERLKVMFSYGWKLLASGLLYTASVRIRQLVIGKVFQPVELAFYTRADQFPNLIVSNIDASINAVLLPTMSAEQDNVERVRAMTRRAIKTSSLVMMPIMMGLAVAAEPVVRIVLTDKWLSSVPYMQIFCFSYAFWTVHTSNLQAMKALGRSDYFLGLDILKQTVSLIVLVLAVPYGMLALALTMIPMSFFSQIVNAWPNKKLLGYSYWKQVQDMLPQMVITCIMGAVIWPLKYLHLVDWQLILLQFAVGAVVYIGLAFVLKIESFTYLMNVLKNMRAKRGNL